MSTKRFSGTLMAGVVLIALGLLSLLGQIFRGFPFWSYLWPLVLIGFGGLFFVGMFAGGKSFAGLAIPGTIIAGLGLMMFFQNLTGYWESWAYSWTIILVLVGLGIFIMGLYSEDLHRRQAGLRVIKVGAILFVIFGGFFELIFNAFRPFGIQQYIFPLLLVGLGVYLVLIRSGLLSTRHVNSNNPTIDLSQEQK
jgi:multisubunit Na+/H+ antiporter MnhC subunit